MPSRTVLLLLVSLLLHPCCWRADCLSNRCVNRRNALDRLVSSRSSAAAAAFTSLVLFGPSSARADTTTTTTTTTTTAAAAATTLIQGTVTLRSQELIMAAEKQLEQKQPALYITCRPDRMNNVPAAVLSGTRGKPPLVLAARIVDPHFPYNFVLTAENLTPEGESFWWKNEDLIISARWDYDGVAATRSPEDLVGRGVWHRDDETVVVQLEGRGAFGKFATKKN